MYKRDDGHNLPNITDLTAAVNRPVSELQLDNRLLIQIDQFVPASIKHPVHIKFVLKQIKNSNPIK